MSSRDIKRLSLVPFPLHVFSGCPQALSSPESLSEKDPTFLKDHSDTGPDMPILENSIVAAVSPSDTYPSLKSIDCSLHRL